MGKTVRDLMTSNPRTIDSNQSVMDAARIMRDEDVGMVPITEGDRLIGTITDRDIAIRIVAEGSDPSTAKAIDVASRELVTIDPQQDLDEALRLMTKHQVRRLPAIEDDGRLVGVVAQADIAQHASASKTGQLVEGISK
ncbi:MAG TPA: CBS domain-containing protein [Gaiellaceae bacterium]|jgi:CBS domain-containing protein